MPPTPIRTSWMMRMHSRHCRKSWRRQRLSSSSSFASWWVMTPMSWSTTTTSLRKLCHSWLISWQRLVPLSKERPCRLSFSSCRWIGPMMPGVHRHRRRHHHHRCRPRHRRHSFSSPIACQEHSRVDRRRCRRRHYPFHGGCHFHRHHRHRSCAGHHRRHRLETHFLRPLHYCTPLKARRKKRRAACSLSFGRWMLPCAVSLGSIPMWQCGEPTTGITQHQVQVRADKKQVLLVEQSVRGRS